MTIPFERVDFGPTTQVTTQVEKDDNLDETSRKIVDYCNEAKSTREIAAYLVFSERKSASKYIRALLEQGRLAMTIPEKPNSSKQKYIAIK